MKKQKPKITCVVRILGARTATLCSCHVFVRSRLAVGAHITNIEHTFRALCTWLTSLVGRRSSAVERAHFHIASWAQDQLINTACLLPL